MSRTTATTRHRTATRLAPSSAGAPLDVRGIAADRKRLSKQYPSQLSWRRVFIPPKLA